MNKERREQSISFILVLLLLTCGGHESDKQWGWVSTISVITKENKICFKSQPQDPYDKSLICK